MSEIDSILTSSNKFDYRHSTLTNVIDGFNYFSGQWTPVTHGTLVKSATGQYYEDVTVTQEVYQPFVLYHVYGTISKDIVDNIAFWHVAEVYNVNDPTVIIPATQSETDYVDWIFMVQKHPRYGFKSIIQVIACDKSYNEITTAKFSINFNIDIYSF